MKTTLEALRPLEPGKPVTVVERDESGALVGAWIGYWSYKRGTVALYPDGKNRFVSWPGGVLPKKRVVSDRSVKIRPKYSSNDLSSMTKTILSSSESIKETKLPIQERMNI